MQHNYNQKVIYGLERMGHHLRRVVLNSRFVPTEDKEPLLQEYEEIVKKIRDAVEREGGAIPHTPEYLKRWKDGINKSRKKRGQEPLQELRLVDELIGHIVTDGKYLTDL